MSASSDKFCTLTASNTKQTQEFHVDFSFSFHAELPNEIKKQRISEKKSVYKVGEGLHVSISKSGKFTFSTNKSIEFKVKCKGHTKVIPKRPKLFC